MKVQERADLLFAILTALKDSGKPIGSGALFCFLMEQRFAVSAPTIGRRLQELEQRGLVRKVNVDGRVLTAEGEKYLEELRHDRHLDSSGRKFLKLLKNSSQQEIFDVLEARRLVEGHTAALAAKNASQQLVRRLEELIAGQQRLLNAGQMGIEQDVKFHEAIADASGNKVLAGVVRLLRSHLDVNRAVNVIRGRMGARIAGGHYAIVAAICDRDPEAARRAMDSHISELITDVNRYWKEISRANRQHRNRAPAAKAAD